jgi:hypothetical protein
MRMMREEQVETLDLNLSLGYVPGRAYLGLLRIAYLTMFKRLGYRYILSPAAGVIRRLISEFKRPAPELGRIVAELTRISPVPTKPVLCVPVPSANVVIVMMKFVTNRERHYATLMPFPHIEAERVIEALVAANGVLQKFPTPLFPQQHSAAGR